MNNYKKFLAALKRICKNRWNKEDSGTYIVLYPKKVTEWRKV